MGRLLWHTCSARENVEASYRLYRKSEMAFPDLAFVKFMRVNCLTYMSSEASSFQDQLDGVKNLNPSFYVRFLLFKLEVEAKIRGSRSKKEGTETSKNIDLVSYVEFQKYYVEAQKYNSLAITSIRDFWALFLQPSISVVAYGRHPEISRSQVKKPLPSTKH